MQASGHRPQRARGRGGWLCAKWQASQLASRAAHSESAASPLVSRRFGVDVVFRPHCAGMKAQTPCCIACAPYVANTDRQVFNRRTLLQLNIRYNSSVPVRPAISAGIHRYRQLQGLPTQTNPQDTILYLPICWNTQWSADFTSNASGHGTHNPLGPTTTQGKICIQTENPHDRSNFHRFHGARNKSHWNGGATRHVTC
jgi:hypothetical protein